MVIALHARAKECRIRKATVSAPHPTSPPNDLRSPRPHPQLANGPNVSPEEHVSRVILAEQATEEIELGSEMEVAKSSCK
jgi:hypothetical protein